MFTNVSCVAIALGIFTLNRYIEALGLIDIFEPTKSFTFLKALPLNLQFWQRPRYLNLRTRTLFMKT